MDLLFYEFLEEFLPLIHDKIKIYLETNATLTKEFERIKNHIDIIAGDIKLPSATGLNVFEKHKEFYKLCKKEQRIIRRI